jgi:3-oxoacyl-[acyl-carrier protein] reductase
MRLPYQPFRDHGQLFRARRDRHRRIMKIVIPGSGQSNRDRAELVALRRLGTVEDCAKVVEFLATDLSAYVTGAVIPINGGLVRG